MILSVWFADTPSMHAMFASSTAGISHYYRKETPRSKWNTYGVDKYGAKRCKSGKLALIYDV